MLPLTFDDLTTVGILSSGVGYGTAVDIYHYSGGTSEDEGSKFLANVSNLLP